MLTRRSPIWPAARRSPLLMTGYAEQLQDAVAGGLRVLTKPATPEEILGELRALMGQPAELRSRPASVR